MNTAYLSLGSNIDPEKNLPEALLKISNLVEVCGMSSIWITPSVGFDGPDFLNAAICIKTNFNATEFKEEYLCSIEESMGRVRTANKNAPRTIDIDIVIFNNYILDPNLFEYDHLIFPMAELLPTLQKTHGSPTLHELAQQRLQKSSASVFGHFSK